MAKEQTNPYKLVLKAHRLSFVHVKEPHAFDGDDGEKQDPKYHVTFLIPKDSEDATRIKEVLKAKFNEEKNGHFKGMTFTSTKLKNPLRDGDEYADEQEAKGNTGPAIEAYRGCYYLRASSKSQPAVYDRNKQDIIDLDDKEEGVYSGCWCRGVIACYSFDNKSKGWGFFLNSLMKIKNDEPFGGFTATPDDYDDMDDDDLI